jgi:hypothetical protein
LRTAMLLCLTVSLVEQLSIPVDEDLLGGFRLWV